MGLQFLRVGIPASVISDMDAPMRSLGGRTVPDGAVGGHIFSSMFAKKKAAISVRKCGQIEKPAKN